MPDSMTIPRLESDAEEGRRKVPGICQTLPNNDRGARERRDNPDTLHTCAHDSSRKRNAQTQLGPVVAVDLVPKRGMRARLSHAAYPNREAPSALRTPLPISGHVTHPHHPFSLATSVGNGACTRAAPRASRSRHARA